MGNTVLASGELRALAGIGVTVGADQVFEALTLRAAATHDVSKSVGRRGGVAALQDVDQQAGRIAIAFGGFELGFPGFDIGWGEMGQGRRGAETLGVGLS